MTVRRRLDPVARELRDALTRLPRTLPPRWLYDDRGSELFSQITTVPEYYQTETERAILSAHSASIAELTEATTVIELGSGTSDKTRALLDAFVAHGLIDRFVPLDVSEATLFDASAMLRERHPEVLVEPVVGDFTRHLQRLTAVPTPGRRLVMFLGGTIGNFYVEERRAFLGALSDVLAPGDWVLVGIDQLKSLDRLVAAYDDDQGITEAFIRNALTNVNRTYGGDLDVGNFEYVPFWDGRQDRIDMRLRAGEPMRARFDGLDLDLELAAGEEIRVEISSKFRPSGSSTNSRASVSTPSVTCSVTSPTTSRWSWPDAAENRPFGDSSPSRNGRGSPILVAMFSTTPSHPSRHRQSTIRRVVPGLVVASLAIAACGGSGSDSASDSEQNCRDAQRLVDDVAAGDSSDIDRSLDRLRDIDGIDDLTDVGDAEDLATSDDPASAQDLADQFDGDLDCELDVPEDVDVADSAPDTSTDGTDTTSTEPETNTPVTAVPAPSDPVVTVGTEPDTTDTTEPADTPAPAPSAPGQPLAVVEIGATGPGIDRSDLAQEPTAAITEAGVGTIPIPAGPAVAIEYRLDYDLDSFSDTPSYSTYEQFSFTAATPSTIDEVRTAFVDAITAASSTTYEATDSTSTQDDVSQSATTLSPDFSDDNAVSYDVVAAQSTELPGVVLIEITASGTRQGAVPALTAAASAALDPANQIGTGLGWTLEGWSWSPGVNEFDGTPFTTGELKWAAGSGTAADVAPTAAALLAVLPAPTYEDVEDDREFYTINDNENWSVSYSDSFEGAELRATYDYSA